jgi:hypothetical protein
MFFRRNTRGKSAPTRAQAYPSRDQAAHARLRLVSGRATALNLAAVELRNIAALHDRQNGISNIELLKDQQIRGISTV